MPNAQGVSYVTEQGKVYERYINSKAWAKKRAQYWRSAGRSCKVKGCDSTSDLQVHHHTYERLGKEHLLDLVGVCQAHHREIHTLHDATGRKESLTRVTERVTGLNLRKTQVQKTTLPTSSFKTVSRGKKKSAEAKRALRELEEAHRGRPQDGCNCRSCRKPIGKKIGVLDTVGAEQKRRAMEEVKKKNPQWPAKKGEHKQNRKQKVVATRAARTRAHEQAQAVARQIAANRNK